MSEAAAEDDPRYGDTRVWWSVAGRGPGPAIVLVHGSLDRSAGLLRLSRRLARTHPVVRYDRRGYGRSSRHPGPFGLDQHVEDLVDVIVRYAGTGEPGATTPPVVLVGHSYGGNVALALADRHPELVAAVGVYESPLSWLDWWPTHTAGSMALAGSTDPAAAAEAFMRRLVGDERWERLPASTRAARRDEGIVMVSELADLRRGAPWEPARITVPVVAMCGEHGAEHHRAAMSHVASVIDGARVVEIPGARHFGPNTHADQVASEVLALIGRGA